MGLKLRLVSAGTGIPVPVTPESGSGLAGLGAASRYSGSRRQAPSRRWLTLALRPEAFEIVPPGGDQGDPFPILFI